MKGWLESYNAVIFYSLFNIRYPVTGLLRFGLSIEGFYVNFAFDKSYPLKIVSSIVFFVRIWE